jgi:pyruvate dehydrogenase E2 component (dihydrolipoamide acetyltransferase)
MTEITMPRLSDSMEAGTILSWLKADGEDVLTGEDLVEIETDKATVTHAAEASGVLTIVAPEGASLPVGATIARIAAAVAPSSNGHPTAASAVVASPVMAAPVRGDGKPNATPLARRVAAAHGVALAEVDGSGPRGRVTRPDVLKSAGLEEAPAPQVPVAAPQAPAPGPAPSAPSAKGDVVVVEPTRLQGVVARRMAEAKATIPDFQVQTEVVMDAAIAFRAQLKASGAQAPSFNDLIVKAAAIALREYPRANGAWRDGCFEEYSRVNVGIAVAADGVLVVPTIFDVDSKSLGAIAAEARRLAGRVRDGSVTPAELAGGTFTVSNLGMYGMTAITPVINMPQAAILGVGALRETLARVDGEIVDRALMTLTLSCDHRILYGAEAAQFLSRIRDLLETPIKLAL